MKLVFNLVGEIFSFARKTFYPVREIFSLFGDLFKLPQKGRPEVQPRRQEILRFGERDSSVVRAPDS